MTVSIIKFLNAAVDASTWKRLALRIGTLDVRKINFLLCHGFFLWMMVAIHPQFAAADPQEMQPVLEDVRRLFWAGQIDASAERLRQMALQTAPRDYSRTIYAAELLCDILRYQRSRSFLKKYDGVLKQIRVQLEAARAEGALAEEDIRPVLDRMDGTKRFLSNWFLGKPKTVEDYGVLDRSRAMKMARDAGSLISKDPLRSTVLYDAFWIWARRAAPDEVFNETKNRQMMDLAQAIDQARLYLFTDFWSRHRSQNEGRPEKKAVSDRLAAFSKAIKEKDLSSIRDLFHPDSSATDAVINLVAGGRVSRIEYTDIGSPEMAWHGRQFSVRCTVRTTQQEGDRAGKYEENKTLIFRNKDGAWLLHRV